MKKIKTKNEKNDEVNQIIKKLSKKDVREFLENIIKDDENIRDRFLNKFSDIEKDRFKEYSSKIKTMIRSITDRHGFVRDGKYINILNVYEEIKVLIDQNKHNEAKEAYRGVFEAIAKKIGNIDDSDGCFGEIFSYCLNEYSELVRDYIDDKKFDIDFLFKRAKENDPDFFATEYLDAMLEICQNVEEYNYAINLLKTEIPDILPSKDSNRYDRFYFDYVILTCAKAYLAIKNDKEFSELFNKYNDNSKELNILHIKLLLDKKETKKALEYSEVLLDKDVYFTNDIIKIIYPFYRKRDRKKYIDYAYNLMIRSSHYKKYLTELKSELNEIEFSNIINKWKDVVKTYNYFSYELMDTLIDLEMYEDAFDVLSQTSFLDVLKHYFNVFKDRKPLELIELYKKLILELLERQYPSRGKYRKAKYHIYYMKKIKIYSKECDEFIDYLREKYKKRTALLDEFEEL